MELEELAATAKSLMESVSHAQGKLNWQKYQVKWYYNKYDCKLT